METIISPPLPLWQRRVRTAFRLCIGAFGIYIGYRMLLVGISVFEKAREGAWEQRFLIFSAMLSFFFTVIAWKTRSAGGWFQVVGFLALAMATLLALTHYEWRWFAYASTGILGMCGIVLSLGYMLSAIDER